MTNPTNASVDTVKEGFPKITTQTLGIANERVRDLTGYVLHPQELSTAVVKFLMCYNISEKDIYSVKIGTTKENELKIIAEVNAEALQSKKKKTSWIDFEEYDDNETLIPDYLYNAWQNKIYHGKKKHLQLRQIRRDKNKYISISINPEIFIAFVYDINFTDKMYKISAPAKRWKSSKQLDDMSGKERKHYRAIQTEYSNYGITQCMFVAVTFSEDKENENNGFHPNQVDNFYSDK